MDTQVKVRRVERVRHEPKRRELEVSSVTPIGTGFVSVTFKGEALADFVSSSFDDHVKFIFASASGEEVSRDYTPRHFERDGRELTIEFMLHGEGAATTWARQAAPGQRVIVAGPRGSMIIPQDFDWHLLAGDATALPAIQRRLEELPPSGHAISILACSPDLRLDLSSQVQSAIRWVNDDEALIAAIRALPLPQGEGFVWCAGEASTMTRLRAVLAQEKGVSKEAMRVAAYWKCGASNHHETLG